MMRKIIEIADECNIHGIKRIVFYIISPFVMTVAYVKGYIIGFTEGRNLK